MSIFIRKGEGYICKMSFLQIFLGFVHFNPIILLILGEYTLKIYIAFLICPTEHLFVSLKDRRRAWFPYRN